MKVNWNDIEITNLKELMEPIISNTKRWVEAQPHILSGRGIQATFQRMGNEESSDEDMENESAAQSSHSKGFQQKEVNKEEHPKKKLKSS